MIEAVPFRGLSPSSCPLLSGFQGMASFHDNITTGFRNIFGEVASGVFFNFPSMPPSFAINFMGAAMNDYPSLIGQSFIYGEGSN